MKTLTKGSLFVIPVLAAVLSAPCVLVAEESYMGYEEYDCTGEGEEFETKDEMYRDMEIISFTVMDSNDDECYSAQMETMTVTATRPTSASLSFNIFWTPSAFYRTPWKTINRNWTTEQYQESAEAVDACFRVWGLLMGGRVDKEYREDFMNALNADFDLAINQDLHKMVDGEKITLNGSYTHFGASNRGLVELNGLHMLEGAATHGLYRKSYQPLAEYFQVHLHEAIHAGRRQSGRALSDHAAEERKVQMLTYYIYKALWGKEPPGYYGWGASTPRNLSYKKDEDKISCWNPSSS